MKYSVVFEQKRHGKDTICKIYVVDGDVSYLLTKGRASCAPSDNFDIKVGKQLALTRAYNKLAENWRKNFLGWVKKNL